MTKTKCPDCNGNKKVMGAGYMFHDCETCLGKGEIDSNLAEALDSLKEELDEVIEGTTEVTEIKIEKKKPGRKPGWNKKAE
jgi:hypothetical protein